MRRPRVHPSGIHGRWGGPDSHGHLRFWGPPGCCYPHRPFGTASASRTRVSRATTSHPGRWTIAVIRLRPGDSNPDPRLMKARCSPLHQAAMIDGENRGPAGPLGRFERPEIRLLGGCQTHSGVSGEDRPPIVEKTGEPRLSHIMNRHHVRWCRSCRAVVSSVGLTQVLDAAGRNETCAARLGHARAQPRGIEPRSPA